MGYDMVIEASTLLDDVGLEVVVPLDLSLASGEMSEGWAASRASSASNC